MWTQYLLVLTEVTQYDVRVSVWEESWADSSFAEKRPVCPLSLSTLGYQPTLWADLSKAAVPLWKGYKLTSAFRLIFNTASMSDLSTWNFYSIWILSRRKETLIRTVDGTPPAG